MPQQDKHSKTEKPTAKRLKEAQKKGETGKSQEVAIWVQLLLATFLAPFIMRRIGSFLSELIFDVNQAIAAPDERQIMRLFGHSIMMSLVMVAPLMLAVAGAGAASSFFQTGWHPSTHQLRPKFSSLNPLQGAKRLISPGQLWKGARDLLKVLILGVLVFLQMSAVIPLLTQTGGMEIPTIVAIVGKHLVLLVRNVALLGILLAAVDLAVSKRQALQRLRMTKTEIRDEMKQMEGDPTVKGRIRSKMAEISGMRMLAAATTADVVVTNPSHYAIALLYRPEEGEAPRTVAKGTDYLARRIRETALEHRIPVIEEPPLARALYANAALGEEIPIELYEAIARLLAFVFSLRAHGKAAGVHTPPVRLWNDPTPSASNTALRLPPENSARDWERPQHAGSFPQRSLTVRN